MSKRLLAILTLAVCIMSPAGHADEYRFSNGKILVSNVWAHATDGKESAIFMTIRNDGDNDRLTWVDLPFGEGLTIEIVDRNVNLLDSIPVPGGSAVTELKPAGRYVMVLALQKPLQDGMRIAMRMNFSNAGMYEIQVPVRAEAPRWVTTCRQNESLFDCGTRQYRSRFERGAESR